MNLPRSVRKSSPRYARWPPAAARDNVSRHAGKQLTPKEVPRRNPQRLRRSETSEYVTAS